MWSDAPDPPDDPPHRPGRPGRGEEGFWLPSLGRPSLDGAPGPSPLVSVRMPAPVKERLVVLARWQGSSVPEVVRQAVEQRFDDLARGRYGVPPPRRGRLPDVPWPRRAVTGLLADGDGDLRDLAQAYADGDAGVVAEEE